MKKIIIGIILGLLSLCIVLPVLADAVGNITLMTANPSDTSIVLTWVKPTGANTTVIRYRTDTYPTLPTDGASAYNGTSFQCTVSDLTAGQVYYFSAWGQHSDNYSETAYNLAMSTLAVAIPSGAEDNTTVSLPTPTISANMAQDPDVSGFNLEPFTSIIAYFNESEGGLGMPENNLWETLAIFGIVGSGILVYTRIRNFFVAFAVVFVATIICVGLHLVQGWLVGVEIIIAGGVWAIEKYMQ